MAERYAAETVAIATGVMVPVVVIWHDFPNDGSQVSSSPIDVTIMYMNKPRAYSMAVRAGKAVATRHRIIEATQRSFIDETADFTLEKIATLAGVLPSLDTLWGERQVIHVNALKAFDGAAVTQWKHVIHGAPVLSAERRAVAVDLPWSETDSTPPVLLSFSTVPEQRSPQMLQRTLDALSVLPVHIVATTGGIVEPSELVAPRNAHLVNFADHDALMNRAALVVDHGGHGTTMRALRHGLPMVGIPAKGADQAPITQLLEQWKVGRALPGDANVEHLRAAAEQVLSTSSFREEARRRSEAFAGLDGAQLAVTSIESVILRRP